MKFLRPFVLLSLLVTLCISFVAISPSLCGQSAANQAPAVQPVVPDWQTAAGGKATFDVASVKPNKSDDTQHSNVPLSAEDMFEPTGGLLSASNYPLGWYIYFAYKLTPYQSKVFVSQFPKLARDRYDIEGRVSGNPTKDRFRLMMQALLADRFKLAIHYEIRQVPLLAMVLDKPARLGPHLQPHPEGSPCPTTVVDYGGSEPPARTVAGGYPESCGELLTWQEPGRIHYAGRNVTIQALASRLFGQENVERPILDRTGLTGRYDLALEWALQPNPMGPNLLEALKEQLGLKLVPQTGPVDVLVIDHVEEPSPN